MSDIDPDLPDYLVDAILSEGPPPDAVDLIKNAFTLRTLDTELMELSFDSVLDTAGVRDAGAQRTMEFTLGETSVVIEVDGTTVMGSLEPPREGSVEVRVRETQELHRVDEAGRFRFTADPGAVTIVIRLADQNIELPAFIVGD